MAPLALLDGTNGHPLAPMVMAKMAPMVHPIAIGDHQWCHLNGANGAITKQYYGRDRHKMGVVPMAPMVPMVSQWLAYD